MNVVYRFRIYPNKIQQELFAKTFGCVRFVYNRMLSEKKECYEKTGKNLKVTPAKYKAEFPWLKEVDSLALCNAQLHLQIAYKNFFRIRQHCKIREDACLKGASVCLEADGRYYVSLLYFCEEKPVETRNIRQAVGLDFSMKELYVDSNGKHAGYPHYFRNSEEKLAKAQRKLSHCRKGSNRYKKQQKKVARIHTHIAHQRKDYLHKESRKITNFYDIVCIEDLDLKTMSGEHHFGKSVHDNGWRMFTDFLQYKLEREGKKLVRIDRWYPSSRTCSCCGKIKHDLKLEERVYLCSCGNRMDRDENAAINICREGLRISGIILEKSEKAS